MEDKGDWDVPGAVEGPRGRPGEPGAVPIDPMPPKLMEEETGVGKIEEDTPAPPRFRLLRLDVMFPNGPSFDGVGPGPGKPI